MNRILPHLAWASALPLFAPTLLAQTSISYSADEINNSAILLSGANTPLTLQVASGTATQGGNISESGGSFGFTKDGAGTLILSGANTYTGTTAVLGGTLQTATTGALGTGTVQVESSALLRLTGGTHSVASVEYNALSISNVGGDFLVVSGGAVLNSAGSLGAFYDGPATDGILVTGAGSRVIAPQLGGDRPAVTVAAGGTLQLTNQNGVNLREFTVGAKAGEAPVAPGFLALPSNYTPEFIFSDAYFNHTATDYWFTSDGTESGASVALAGSYVVLAGTTIFKNSTQVSGVLSVEGGEARFTEPTAAGFTIISIATGGTASFAANPLRASFYQMNLNGGTFRATESFTLVFDQTDRLFQSTGGTFVVDADKTLTLGTIHAPIGSYDIYAGQSINGTGSYTKDGPGTLVLERDYTPIDLGVPDFTVRQGTLRTAAFVFDEVVIGKFAGDDGNFTVPGTNVLTWAAGVPLSLGFMYANYWTPSTYGPPILAEFDASGVPASTDFLVPVAQSRTLTLGEQTGSVGNLTLNEGAAGGWYVDNGLVVIGGAGTGNVTIAANHFLYNNGRDIVVGQSAGGVGNVTVGGANAQLNAGVDLTPLDPFNLSGVVGESPEIDRGVGNILIGQGGVGHVSVTDNARILAGQTFIGDGSDLTLGSGGTIYGGFTVQDGGTLHALDGATFAFTLDSGTEASFFETGSTLLVDPGADLIFQFTQDAGFGVGSYTLFAFESGVTLTSLAGADFLATGLAGYDYDFSYDSAGLTVTISVVPEPSAYAMLAGCIGLALAAGRRRRWKG